MTTQNNKPRYWATLEELNGDSEVARLKTEEFFEKPAEIMSEAGEENLSFTRRDLLKLTGAAMVFAAAGCARRPVEKIIPYVVAPEEIKPGIANYYASTCAGCSAGCGVLVKTREGRPIKLEGNAAHPINHGTLCARGQASLLDLYDPDRLQKPTHFYRGKRTPLESTLAEIDAEILKAAKANGGSTVLVTKSASGPASRRALNEFLAAFPNVRHVTLDPLGDDDVLIAQQLAFGNYVKPRYRFDRAEYVLSFGADPLGAGSSPVEAAYGYGQQRIPGKSGMAKLVVFEPAMSVTGANADERFLVTPDDFASLALALANLLAQSGRNAFEKEEDNQKLRSALSGYSAAKAEKQAGLADGTLKRFARELLKQPGKSIVMGGGSAARNNNSLSLQIACAVINVLLGNEGHTVDGSYSYSQQSGGSSKAIIDLTKDLSTGRIDNLILIGVNPAYSAPASLKFGEAMGKAKLIVAVSDRIDETAALADYILPLSNSLESWGDIEAQNGLFAIRQPVINPLYTSRSPEECYLAWTTAARTPNATPPTMYAFVQESWKSSFMKDAGSNQFIDWWNDRLRAGFFDTVKREGGAEPRKLDLNALQRIRVRDGSNQLQLVLQTTNNSFDGSQRNNAWLIETPDPISKVSWDNHVSIAPATAKSMNLKTGDIVKVTVAGFSVEAPIYLQPGVHANVAALALGWGRTKAGRVGNNIGANGFSLAQVDGDRLVYSGIPVSLEKTGKTQKIANMQGHNYIEGRPIVQEATFDAWKQDPHSGSRGEHGEMESIWGDPPKPLNPSTGEDIRWWMTVDTNSCIGCNACSVACQAENNIAVVGKEQVVRGREMSWIRIDRYYSGDEANPEVIHQPMLCQHCSHAPCETVCPVVATTHNDEGLNVQTYNRCVGTRYCSNNCPYKVRRFNWLIDNTMYSPHNLQHPVEMVLNPDVTVRSIGVMEKCTFCVQRIREGHDVRKTNGLNAIPDGTVKPACAQTCPTQAITFGNIKNAESKVAKVAADPRGFQVLAELNTRPAITYLRKLRHRAPMPWDGAEHGAEAEKTTQHNPHKGQS